MENGSTNVGDNRELIFEEKLRTFEQKLEKLDKLLIELQILGVNKLRIAEHKLMSYIENHYPYFNIYASTSFEFQSLAQYQNFLIMHPNIKQIVPSHDSIKNFIFLKNLKTLGNSFQEIAAPSKMPSRLAMFDIELMVNEGCLQGCPNRFGHAGEIMDRDLIHRNDITMSNSYYPNIFCNRFNPILAMVRANVIYPWEIEEYEKIGITNFKMVGRDAFTHRINDYINEYLFYLKGIDNYKNIENLPINTFIHHLASNLVLKQLKVKEVRKLLPQIGHFIKKGELCATDCGVSCHYCYKCAEKIGKMFEERQKIIERRSVAPCRIS